MPTVDYLRNEIAHMRIQVGRRRKEILQLQRAGIATQLAEALLQRMLDKVDDLCEQRDLKRAEEKHLQPTYASGKRIARTPAHRRV